MMYWMSSTAMGSTPAKGSSRRTNLGSTARALAISQRLLSPPESWMPLLLRTFDRLNSSIRLSSLSSLSSLVMSDISITDMMLSSTDIFLNTEASWGR